MLCFKKKKRRFLNSFSLVLKPISSSSPLSRPHNENSAAFTKRGQPGNKRLIVLKL